MNGALRCVSGTENIDEQVRNGEKKGEGTPLLRGTNSSMPIILPSRPP